MFSPAIYPKDLSEAYRLFLNQLDHLIEKDLPIVSNLANVSALLAQFLTKINWVGFYLLENDQLVLGPFQGLPACTKIKIGTGVCGTAVKERKSIRVPDVHEFPGHIACDSASLSELVIPLIKNGKVLGVLDIDSPILERFTPMDQLNLEKAVDLVVQKVF